MLIMKINNNQQGSIIVSILVISIMLSSFIFGLLVVSNQNLARSKQRLLLLQTQYAAESGADSAVAMLNSGVAYTGTGSTDTTLLTSNLYKATYSVAVIAGSDAKEKIITAVGKVYSPASSSTPTYTRTVEVIAQRSSTSTSSGILTRNILDLASGVKNVSAVNVYVNGFINMNKNTTNLIAENITVADKNTGAGNCSIGGTGNLLKPASFTTPGQTKTIIKIANNNCINPPGNVSNTDFDVFANQTNIGKVQSTVIPWSQYMDGSYQSSPGGCNDWTSGSFPRDIPSTGNTKKTHYPDSASGIASSCGSSGNLDLATGQYNIRDHVHLRANLCGSSGCTPTFNNPDATIKFVFVEGTINFSSLQTAAGSGPIVFVSYGTDPAALASVCPYGGSIYLSNAGDTNSPKVYFIASNGICFDKTKFGSSPAMGGVSGKNIYISTNPGSPFDLALDPTFPVDQIPVDLSWRAVRYRRL